MSIIGAVRLLISLLITDFQAYHLSHFFHTVYLTVHFGKLFKVHIRDFTKIEVKTKSRYLKSSVFICFIIKLLVAPGHLHKYSTSTLNIIDYQDCTFILFFLSIWCYNTLTITNYQTHTIYIDYVIHCEHSYINTDHNHDSKSTADISYSSILFLFTCIY